jgi:hypothetical protein
MRDMKRGEREKVMKKGRKVRDIEKGGREREKGVEEKKRSGCGMW